MAGDYPDWDMSDETRAALRDQMNAAVDTALSTGLDDTVPAAGDLEATVAYVGRERLTEAMAGTGDKTSREWKNARDRLSRYRRGARTPDSGNQAAMQRAVDQRREDRRQQHRRDRRQQLDQRRHMRVRYNATFKTSRTYWAGYADADLTGPAVDDFLEAQEAGDGELAAQIVCHHYGLDPEFVEAISDVSDYTVQWLPPGGRRWPPFPPPRLSRPPPPGRARSRRPAGRLTPRRALARMTSATSRPWPGCAPRTTRT